MSRIVLFDLDVFSFLLTFCTKKYIHCDRKPNIFQLIIKYLRIFKIFIEEIKKKILKNLSFL